MNVAAGTIATEPVNEGNRINPCGLWTTSKPLSLSALASAVVRILGAALLWTAIASAQVERVVVLKVDGLPQHLVEQYLETPSAAGPRPTRLPWIRYVFRENGAILNNFYVRGLSLSSPSWSLLDTGRHLEIRGNVEYDRYTLRAYDYLNFFPFYFKAGVGDRVDMSGVELLDDQRIPLLIDRFPYGAWFQGSQLLQRGVNWRTLDGTLKRALTVASASDFIDEWQVGWAWSESWYRQNEEELVKALKNPNIRYLDLFSGEYDHLAHLVRDPVSQLHEIEATDALVGRVWNAIAESPLADKTALILVSDHGMNTSPDVYGQGYNFVDWLSSGAGGAHHVLTNRHPLTEFKLKGLDPFVSAVVTPSSETRYLKGLGEAYPTAMIDPDGNERASVALRNSTFNVLSVLLDQLIHKRVAGAVRAATITAFFDVLDRVRPEWQADLAALDSELAAQDALIAERQKIIAARPRKPKWTPEQLAQGVPRQWNREAHQLDVMKNERIAYAGYAATIRRLLSLTAADFDPGKFKLQDLIPSRSFGPPNSLWDLQNYVTGPGPDGLVLDSEGFLDWERSFTRMNYFDAFASIRVRNNVQEGVSAYPVDFIAVRIPGRDAIWLYKDSGHQALIESGAEGIRYTPIANLSAAPDGSLRYEDREWNSGFPLALVENHVPVEWLQKWHSEREWFEATHKTLYSTGVVGLVEQLLDLGDPAPSPYEDRKQRLRRTDLLVFANDHWNFNVRGFNPGGNHGSFLRPSTHSVLMIAGGKDTGLPRGLRIETPYDNLSFVPTVLELMGRPEPDLPGPAIQELLPQTRQ